MAEPWQREPFVDFVQSSNKVCLEVREKFQKSSKPTAPNLTSRRLALASPIPRDLRRAQPGFTRALRCRSLPIWRKRRARLGWPPQKRKRGQLTKNDLDLQGATCKMKQNSIEPRRQRRKIAGPIDTQRATTTILREKLAGNPRDPPFTRWHPAPSFRQPPSPFSSPHPLPGKPSASCPPSRSSYPA